MLRKLEEYSERKRREKPLTRAVLKKVLGVQAALLLSTLLGLAIQFARSGEHPWFILPTFLCLGISVSLWLEVHENHIVAAANASAGQGPAAAEVAKPGSRAQSNKTL